MQKRGSVSANRSALAKSLHGLASTWKRRFVWVEGGALCYGGEPAKAERKIPLQHIIAVETIPATEMVKEYAPNNLLNFGWRLRSSDRQLIFAAESGLVRDSFVAALRLRLLEKTSAKDDVPTSMTTGTTR